MRTLPILFIALTLSGCAVLLPVADVATRPFDKKGTFEEVQAAYTANLRFGLYEEALPQVEPELRPRFRSELSRFRELRLSDAHTESIEIDTLRREARAMVVLTGYWLSSPYERQIRVVQRWRRAAPSQEWFVTPDFEALLAPKDASRTSALAPTK